MPSRHAAASLALLVVASPSDAAAHGAIPGIEGFYTGLLHPLSTASQILAILGLGVLVGQGGRQTTKVSLVAFGVSCLFGILLGQIRFVIGWADVALLAVAIVAAALAALRPKVSRAVPVLIGVIGGILIGLVSTPDPGPLGATLVTLSGSLLGASLGVFYVGGGVLWLTEEVRKSWLLIGLRIASAWVATIAILLLALEFAEVQARG